MLKQDGKDPIQAAIEEAEGCEAIDFSRIDWQTLHNNLSFDIAVCRTANELGDSNLLVERYERARAFRRLMDEAKVLYDEDTKDDRSIARHTQLDRPEPLSVLADLKKAAERAWDVVHRLYPKVAPTVNPFAGVERESRNIDTAYVTRSEAYALSAAIAKLGHPTLALAPLVCFEWHQRPEHVLDGVLTWTDYRPEGWPQSVRIAHPKTGAMVWMPLQDKEGLLFPEIEKAIAATPRLGIPMVLTPGTKGKPRPYSHFYARSLIRRARRAAGLPENVTLKACERGGMTEFGNSEVTEAGIMSLSGHKTPQASRLYVKRTETQRLAAARKRRAWVEAEHNATKSQNEPRNQSQNVISRTQ